MTRARGTAGPLALGAFAVGLVSLEARVHGQPTAVTRSSDKVPEAGAAALLAHAEDAMTGIDYPRSRRLVEQAIAGGGLTLDESTRAYGLLAVSCGQMEDAVCAERAFLKLLALDPRSDLPSRLSPARRTAALHARGFWALRKDAFGMDVDYARRERELVVSVRDPIEWAHTVHVWWRTGERPYTKTRRLAARQVVIDVEVPSPTEPVEAYAFVVDQQENVVMQVGREHDPRVFGISDQELAALLRRDIRGGQTGSYARRLEELGVEVGVHGYVSLELKQVGQATSFDLHHATAMIRANLQRAVSLELALEWEHLGRGPGDFYLPHAFVDLKLHERLVVRGGFFEVPVGAFNEYLYPDFLRITGLPPHVSRSVVPALWSEVGLQLRGRFPLAPVVDVTYAVFVANGLEQADPMPTDGMVAEGGDIRDMRFNDRDEYSSNKAFGGRLGLEAGEFDLGISGYTGRYTIEADRRLSIGDADFSYRGERLTFRSEGAVAFQDTTATTLRKFGFYALAALRPIPHLEPYAQYDLIDVGGTLQRGLAGFAIYPFPHDRTTRNLRLKSEAGFDFPVSGGSTFVWFFQATTGF